MARPKRTPIELVLERFIPEPNTGCWLWTGAVDRCGYGVVRDFVTGKAPKAHRISYMHFRGPIPAGLQLDHLCRVRCCVNPSHLEAVTLQENLRRGEGNKAAVQAMQAIRRANPVTHCPHGHEYTPDNTLVWKGCHSCRECGRISSRIRMRLHRSKSVLKSNKLIP